MSRRRRLRRGARRLRRGRRPRRVRRRGARRRYGSFRAVFDAVTDGAAAAGVVPIENVINGTVRENYDLLLEHDLDDPRRGRRPGQPVPRRAARPAPRRHRARLLAHPGARPGRAFLRARPWQLLTTYNTAGAGKAIADRGERGAAAVLSPRAAACSGWRSWPTTSATCREPDAVRRRCRPGDAAVPRRWWRRAPPDDARRRRPERARNAARGPAGVRRARPEHAQARVAAEPRARLGVRLLGRPRRRHGRSGDGAAPSGSWTGSRR